MVTSVGLAQGQHSCHAVSNRLIVGSPTGSNTIATQHLLSVWTSLPFTDSVACVRKGEGVIFQKIVNVIQNGGGGRK